jgi:DNA-binding transcriptional LysR family regulator
LADATAATLTPVQLDLNLLVALDALLEEGSVGAAADRLHLSQPAMSRTLGRIRRATGDQILVRSGRTMLPTPYASAVRERVHAFVEQANALLTPVREVDLAALERTFTLRCHTALIEAASSAIVTAVRAEAPGVRLRFLSESAADPAEVRFGRVDLQVVPDAPDEPDLEWELLGSAGFVALLARAHPLEELTAENYAAAEHVTVSRRGRLRDPLDDALARLGLARRVVVTVPTVAAAFRLVAGSTLLVSVPEVAVGAEPELFGLRVMPLPLEVPRVPVVMSWHHRYTGDAAHAWLRGLVRGAITSAGVTESPGPD